MASTFGRVLDVTDINQVLEQDVQLQVMLRDLRPTPEMEGAAALPTGTKRRGLVGKR